MRKEILDGRLEYPGTRLLEKYLEKEEDILAMWKALWHTCLSGAEINALFWYEQLGGKVYNEVIRAGCHNGWIISNSLPVRRWSSAKLNENKLLEFVTPAELEEVRKKFQYKRYLSECSASKASTLVRQNGKTRRTGLVRKGFRDAGNTQFGYDMAALSKYEKAVTLNLTKSMDKIRQDYPEMRSDSATYDNVVVGIYEWHKDNAHEVFTTGNSLIDSRGRAISTALKKVMNPISSKDARAALVITYEEE
jgi:hypothetical protein